MWLSEKYHKSNDKILYGLSIEDLLNIINVYNILLFILDVKFIFPFPGRDLTNTLPKI